MTPTESLLKELEELEKNSSRVVAWYSHGDEDGTIRGPWHRWFKCQEGDNGRPDSIGTVKEDCDYAAAAMNSLPALLQIIKTQREALKEAGDSLEVAVGRLVYVHALLSKDLSRDARAISLALSRCDEIAKGVGK